MTDRESLLQAVLDHPDEDAPRLVFADWLEEHGEGDRADFIRIQINLERLPEFDPARPRLLHREQDLLARHRAAWCEGLPKWAAARTRTRFRRGFVAQIDTSARHWVKDAPKVLARAPVESLRLRQSAGCEWARVLSSPQLANVRELNLAEAYLRVEGVEALARSPHLGDLESLDLSDSYLGSEGIAAFARGRFPRLRCLRLRNCTAFSEAAVALAKSPALATLTELDLAKNHVTAAAARALARSEHLGGLQTLILRHNYLESAGAEALAAPGLSGLTRLDLAGCSIGDKGASALAASDHLAGLTDLDLSDNQIGDAGTRAIAGGRHWRALRRLRLGRNRIGDAGDASAAEALARSPLLARVEELDLSGCYWVGGKLMEALAGSRHTSRLRVLDLASSKEGADGVRALARSPRLTGLCSLRVSFCRIGPEGATALAKSPYLRGLRVLDLASCGIGDEGAEALARSPNCAGLTRLVLRNNDISAAGSLALAGSRVLGELAFLDMAYNPVGSEGLRALERRFTPDVVTFRQDR